MDSFKSTLRIGLAVVVMFAVGCTASEPLDEATQSASTATVTTNLATYSPGQSITVSWTGMPGNAQDWVAIAHAGSPPDTGVIAWAYINSQVSGSLTFPGQPAGSYEARAYLNNTFTILATSTFSVAAPVTVTTNQGSYTAGQSITVSWTGMPGNAQDWVAIAAAGAPASSVIQWFYINGQTSGSQTFAGQAVGNYEARMYLNNTFTILATSTFSVTGATVTTDKPVYAISQPITASWTGMPGNAKDWVAIAKAGSSPSSVVQWFYINGQVSGSQAFAGQPAGAYEARMYLNDTFAIVATSTFTVTSATVTTDASSYTTAQTVTASYTNLPGNPNDFIAIAVLGSPDTSFVTRNYTGGLVNGSTQFSGLATGTYEARAYLNNTFTVLARSASFTVSQSCVSAGSQRPVLGSLTSGDLVIGATQTTNTVALSVPLGSSILFTSMREAEPSPTYGATLCELHGADMPGGVPRPAGVSCYRTTAGTDNPSSTGQIQIHWTVATFTSGVSVQRGEAFTYPTTPTTVTLSPAVTTSQSFVLLGGMQNGGTGWGNNEFVRAQLVNSTTLDLRTNVPGTTVAWQVVTMSGSSVQRGTTTFATTATQQAVTVTATPTGTMVLSSYTTDNPSGIAAATLMLQSSLTDPSTILLKRDLGGSNLDISWEVVSLPYNVISGLVTFTAGQSTATSTVTNIAAATSVGICSSQAILGQSGGSTSYAGSLLDLVGEAAVTLTTSSNAVTLQRSTSQAGAEIPWTVIDFAHDCTGM